MKIHYLQHVAFEGLGKIKSWAYSRGHHVNGTKLYENEALPALDSFDFLVVLGGPMSTSDEDQYSWLSDEKHLILSAVQAGKHVLGVCLGAQMMAEVLGGRVYSGPAKEIGWFPVWLTPEARETRSGRALKHEFIPFHWHGDTFDLPPGAKLVASSAAYPSQAFSYGERVMALQFHLEMGRDDVQKIIANCVNGGLPETAWVQQPAMMLKNDRYFESSERLLFDLLDSMTAANSTAANSTAANLTATNSISSALRTPLSI